MLVVVCIVGVGVFATGVTVFDVDSVFVIVIVAMAVVGLAVREFVVGAEVFLFGAILGIDGIDGVFKGSVAFLTLQ